jgi:hypothetical protein
MPSPEFQTYRDEKQGDILDDMTIMRKLDDVFTCKAAGHRHNFRWLQIAGHSYFN